MSCCPTTGMKESTNRSGCGILWIPGKLQHLTNYAVAGLTWVNSLAVGRLKRKTCGRILVPGPTEGESLRVYFHCSDGFDLVIDREGVEVQSSDVLWCALRAAADLMNA